MEVSHGELRIINYKMKRKSVYWCLNYIGHKGTFPKSHENPQYINFVLLWNLKGLGLQLLFGLILVLRVSLFNSNCYICSCCV